MNRRVWACARCGQEVERVRLPEAFREHDDIDRDRCVVCGGEIEEVDPILVWLADALFGSRPSI